MQIQTIKLSKMKDAPYNPRVTLAQGDPEYTKLENSIAEFGYVEPIIWNKRTGYIVGGHQRKAVLQNQGYKQAEAVVVDLSEHDEKILNVLLNRAAGQWDIPKLQQTLDNIQQAGADIDLTGFDEWELQGLVDAYDQLDDILAFDMYEQEEPQEEEPQQPFEMAFTVPIEHKPAVDAFMEAYAAEANDMLADAILRVIREDDDED